MAMFWAISVAVCALAVQANAHVKPAPFSSFHLLTAEAASSRRPTRSIGDVRIVHGNEASPGQFPHQAALYVDMSSFCGGALIAPKWILTAGTCVSRGYGSRYTAFLGAHNMYMPAEKDRLAVTTTWAYTADGFEQATFKDDVALLLLPRDVKTSAYIKPLNLPPKSYASETFAGSSFQLSGWGYASDSSVAIAPNLQYVTLQGVEKKECINTYSYEVYTDNILCCKGSNMQSPCEGDTGSALVKKENDGSYTHIAVASFTPSKGCSSGLPSGFTRTASYLDWISEKTGIAITP